MNQLLIIIALNLILYFRTLKFSLIDDDLQWYEKNKDGFIKLKEVKTLKDMRDFIFHPLYGGATFGTKPKKLFNRKIPAIELDHAFSIFIHSFISVLVYIAFGADKISFMAAILYSCNPMNNQTSIWLNGRRYAMNTILVLGMIIVSKWKLGFLWASILFALTPFFHVTAVFSPILISEKYPWIIPIIIISLLLWRKHIYQLVITRFAIIHDEDRTKFTPKRLIIIVKHYGHYFFKMIFPGICSMTYEKLHYWGITEEGNKNAYSFNKDFYQGISALCISALMFAYLPYQAYVVFILMATIQWCAIIPITQDLADRYVSIPTAFMMFFLSLIAYKYHVGYILWAFVAYYIAMLGIIMKMYKNMASYWEYHRFYFKRLQAPIKYEVHWLLHKKNDPMRAWLLLQDALRYNPNTFILLFQSASCHHAVGEIEMAKKFAESATKNYPIGQKEIQEPKVIAFINTMDELLKNGNYLKKAGSRPK